jgi:hypothetical protein
MSWNEVRFSEEAIELINRINRDLQICLFKAAEKNAKANQDHLVVEEHVINALADLTADLGTIQRTYAPTGSKRRQQGGGVLV